MVVVVVVIVSGIGTVVAVASISGVRTMLVPLSPILGLKFTKLRHGFPNCDDHFASVFATCIVYAYNYIYTIHTAWFEILISSTINRIHSQPYPRPYFTVFRFDSHFLASFVVAYGNCKTCVFITYTMWNTDSKKKKKKKIS